MAQGMPAPIQPAHEAPPITPLLAPTPPEPASSGAAAPDLPDEPIYKEVTVGPPKSEPVVKPAEEPPKSPVVPAKPQTVKATGASLSNSKTAGYLFLFAGGILLLLYCNYFSIMLSTAMTLFRMMPFADLFASYTGDVLNYSASLLVNLLGIFTGILLIIAGRKAIAAGTGLKMAKAALVLQFLILLNYIVRWVIAFITYYAFNLDQFSPVTVFVNLLLEVVLIAQVMSGMRLMKGSTPD